MAELTGEVMEAHMPNVAAEIERYLRTGRSDPRCAAWSGQNFFEVAQAAHRDLITALTKEVKSRTESAQLPVALADIDFVALARRKTEPMVRGMFPRAEQPVVQSLVEQSVQFLAPHNIEAALERCSFLHSAWDVANLYLGALKAPLLGKTAPSIVGVNVNSTCYVSPTYFEHDLPFEDFVIHEVAHLLHNCKRGLAGLRQTRRHERLIEIDDRKRELFAYSCEVYSRILERTSCGRDRLVLAEAFAEDPCIPETQVEPEEVADIVVEAAGRRNGWKVIVARCAPRRTA